jgi:hypothetical protein
MRGSAAATMTALSAAILFAPGCGSGDGVERGDEASEPVRRANFRSLAARDFLLTCPGSAMRIETTRQIERHQELTRLAGRKGADRAAWLGANDWAGLSRHDARESCGTGEEDYRQALATFGATLDAYAHRIAEFNEVAR